MTRAGAGPIPQPLFPPTTLKRSVIAQPEGLSDVALISVPDGFEPPAFMTQLSYHHDTQTRFDLVYGREWQLVGQTPEHVILRLMDRGDFGVKGTCLIVFVNNQACPR